MNGLMLVAHWLVLLTVDLYLGGPEDDLIRSKHVALTSILFYGIQNKYVVLLTGVLTLYVITLWDRKLQAHFDITCKTVQ